MLNTLFNLCKTKRDFAYSLANLVDTTIIKYLTVSIIQIMQLITYYYRVEIHLQILSSQFTYDLLKKVERLFSGIRLYL